MDGSIIISGGCSSSCCFAPLNDTWRLDGSTWTQLPSAAVGPRLYHGASPRNASSHYVFGGTDVATGFFNDLWVMSLSASGVSWSAVSPSGGVLPPGRGGHSQVALPLPTPGAPGGAQASMLVYGGENGTNVLSDFWLYDASTPSGQWQLIDDGSGSDGPGQRTQHAAAVVTDSSGHAWMVLHGGSDAMGTDHNDMWAWPLSTGSGWRPLLPASPSAPQPAARHGHELLSSAAGAHPGAGVSSLYLFAGQNGTGPDSPYVGDTWQVDVDLASFTVAYTLVQGSTTKVSSDEPVARALGSAAVGLPHGQGSEALPLYFGGFSGYTGGLDDLLHNDVWAFELP